MMDQKKKKSAQPSLDANHLAGRSEGRSVAWHHLATTWPATVRSGCFGLPMDGREGGGWMEREPDAKVRTNTVPARRFSSLYAAPALVIVCARLAERPASQRGAAIRRPAFTPAVKEFHSTLFFRHPFTFACSPPPPSPLLFATARVARAAARARADCPITHLALYGEHARAHA